MYAERIPATPKGAPFFFVVVIFALLQTTVCAQTLEKLLGVKASEVPKRNTEVSYVTERKTYTLIADGVSNYVELLRKRLGGLSWPTDMRMVVAGNTIIAKSSAIERTQQAVRLGAERETAQDVQQIPPRTRVEVDVRPEVSGGKKYVDSEAATQTIDEFKKEGESFFSEAWAIVRYTLRACGQLIIFLMILTRMFAYQAANEMVSTYLGRVWGGSVILSALMTLSTIQLFLAWATTGYLLCEWALFLAAQKLGIIWWTLLTLVGSGVLIKASKWFVVSPRDVVDAGGGGANASRAVMRG